MLEGDETEDSPEARRALRDMRDLFVVIGAGKNRKRQNKKSISQRGWLSTGWGAINREMDIAEIESIDREGDERELEEKQEDRYARKTQIESGKIDR